MLKTKTVRIDGRKRRVKVDQFQKIVDEGLASEFMQGSDLLQRIAVLERRLENRDEHYRVLHGLLHHQLDTFIEREMNRVNAQHMVKYNATQSD
jgi:hypothetical protein